MNLPLWVHRAILTLGVIFGVALAANCLFTFALTGRFFRTHVVERLDHPERVLFWNSHGLHLEDGRVVMPAGMRELPTYSDALKAIVERGVEIRPGGEVICLVRADATCGNSSVAYVIKRFDMAEVLAFLGQGETTLSGLSPRKENQIGDIGDNWGRQMNLLSKFIALRKRI